MRDNFDFLPIVYPREFVREDGAIRPRDLGSILSIGASLFGGAMQSNAASSAANAQTQASQNAIAEQRRQFDIQQANNAPFLKTGTAGNARLAYLMGIGPKTGQTGAYGQLTQPFTAQALNADPVYNSGLQFGLSEGEKGINARAIAGGSYDSGATLKGLTRFGNDYGSTKANDAYNRYVSDQSTIFNRLSGISGTGQTAVSQVGQAGQNMANNVSNLQTGIGNAQAAGIVGGANAWGSAAQNVNSAMNNYNSNQTLRALMGNGGGGSYGGSFSPGTFGSTFDSNNTPGGYAPF